MAEREYQVSLSRMIEQTARARIKASSVAEAIEKGELLLTVRDSDGIALEPIVWAEGDPVHDEHVYAIRDSDGDVVWETGDAVEEEDEENEIVEENG